MAGDLLANVRKAYSEEYSINGDTKRANEIALADNTYSPLLKIRHVHAESEPSSSEINEMYQDMLNDISIIQMELGHSALQYKNLVNGSLERLDEVSNKIGIEKERLMDLNMLCGNGSGFNSVKTLTPDDFVTTEMNINEAGIIGAFVVRTEDVDITTLGVIGNGMAGNAFVFNNEEFISKAIDTSDMAFISDNEITTAYEYQKINASKKENLPFGDLSFDGTEAECIITLHASKPISMLVLESDITTMKIVDVMVSSEDDNYKSVITNEIEINNRDYNYKDGSYIYGSGIITFPTSSYIKLSVRSNGHTNDSIAFEYVKPMS